jgi:Resolvase, N terminal domain
MADTILSERISRAPQIRAALYARVSTANNGQDPTMQTRELREYCERRGWNVVSEYVDVGISGTKRSVLNLIAWRQRPTAGASMLWSFRSLTALLDPCRTFFGHSKPSVPLELSSSV